MSESTLQKSRDPYYDNLKGLLILLVCAGHLFAAYKDDPYCYFFYSVIYTFHMPLFFYISGYFSKNAEKASAKAFDTLIVPTIPFELLYFLLHLFMRSENSTQFLTPVFAYWFMFVLFAFRILLPAMRRIRFILPISVILALAAGFNTGIGEYMSLSRFFCMLPFFMAGYFTDRKMMDRIRSMNRILCTVAGLISIAAVWYLSTRTALDLDFNLKSAYDDPMGCAGRLVHFILAAGISLMVMRLMPERESLLTTPGKRTLQIYLLHFYIVTAFEMVNPAAGNAVVNTAVIIVLSIAMTWLLSTGPVNRAFDKYENVTHRLLMKNN